MTRVNFIGLYGIQYFSVRIALTGQLSGKDAPQIS